MFLPGFVALCLAEEPAAHARAIDPTSVTAVEADPQAAEVEPAGPTADETPEPTTGVRVAPGNRQAHPPYFDAADTTALRARYGLPPEPPPDTRKARWDCWIADPVCGFNLEVNATGAFAGRFKQGDVRRGDSQRWASGRAQYDLWVNFPVVVETRGRSRYTRMTLGPKAGAIFSDTGDTWGNVGLVGRIWLGRGRWAPTLEFTSALSFKLARRDTRDLGGAKPKYEMQHGPVGLTADIGVGIGGFGAVIIGGQYDSALARTEVPEAFRTAPGGMLFLGFRGNIAWGGPAAVAVLAHGLTQRYAKEAR